MLDFMSISIAISLPSIYIYVGHLNNLRVLYSQHKTPSSTAKKSARHIPSQPERVLDAPDLLDDFCEYKHIEYIYKISANFLPQLRTICHNWLFFYLPVTMKPYNQECYASAHYDDRSVEAYPVFFRPESDVLVQW